MGTVFFFSIGSSCGIVQCMFINGICLLMVYVSLPRFASGNGSEGMHAENGQFLLTTRVHGGGGGGEGGALWNSPIY